MVFDFPDTPTSGQSVTGPNGQVYVWDGEKWVHGPGGAGGDGGGGGSSYGPSAPTSPNPGDLWFDTNTNQLKVWNGSTWIVAGAGGGSGTSPSPSPPTSPSPGDLWYDTGTNILTVWNGSAWVAVGGGPQLGVTDGSEAAAGVVGEYHSITTAPGIQVPLGASSVWTAILSLALTAGDWDVWGTAFTQNTNAATGVFNWQAAVTQANAAPADYFGQSSMYLGNAPAINWDAWLTPRRRINSPTNFTAYLMGYVSFTGTVPPQPTAIGTLAARRVR